MVKKPTKTAQKPINKSPKKSPPPKKDTPQRKDAPQRGAPEKMAAKQIINGEKAYKLLATQLGVSNNEAKNLIDRGLVFVGNDKIKVARNEVPLKTNFRVLELAKPKKIFEDSDLLALDKPPYITSEEIEKMFPPCRLIHRLDKETSGILLLAKSEEFLTKCINEFKKGAVYKEYIAWVEGVLSEPITIDKAIVTLRGQTAKSIIDKDGKPAHTEITPLEIDGKKTKLKVVIKTGKTHQIRVHLQSLKRPIIGDALYGGREAKRMLLHSKKIKILDYDLEVAEPVWDFN